MKQYQYILLWLILIPFSVYSQEWPKEFREDSLKSTIDEVYQKLMFYKSTSPKKMPLIVSLHQWSSDYAYEQGSLASQTMKKNWNFIHPDFRGANKTPKACGSKFVVNDIDDAIKWAFKNMSVDPSQVHVIGASGGGYAALIHLMKSQININSYHSYVPITDLEAWYGESLSRKNKYAADILACTGSTTKLKRNEARRRSPIYMNIKKNRLLKTNVHLYAGVHDGYTGAVPITHSLKFYNKLLRNLDVEDVEEYIPDKDIIQLLASRSFSNFSGGIIGNRRIHYQKVYKNLELIIFEGGHELLEEEALNRILFTKK